MQPRRLACQPGFADGAAGRRPGTGAGTQREVALDPARNPIARLLAAANLANQLDPASSSARRALLRDPDAAIRRWGAIGILAQGAGARADEQDLIDALEDTSPDVRLIAAEALCGIGRADRAMPVFRAALRHRSGIIRNETLITLARVGAAAAPILPALDDALTPVSDPWPISNRLEQAVALVRAVAGATPSTETTSAAASRLRASRMRYYP